MTVSEAPRSPAADWTDPWYGAVLDRSTPLRWRPWLSRLSHLRRLRQAGFRFQFVPPAYVWARRSDVQVKCRALQGFDFGHLFELFCRHTYGTRFDGQVVVDVGISNGDSSLYFAVSGAQRVIGLEPFPDSFRLAVENVKANALEGVVHPIHAALAGSSGRASLRVSSRHPNANALQPTDARSEAGPDFDDAVEIPTVTLDDLVAQESLERIDFLKLDCEGAEYEILGGLSPAVAARIGRIRLEFHRGLQDLPAVLQRLGFRIVHVSSSGPYGLLEATRSAPV